MRRIVYLWALAGLTALTSCSRHTATHADPAVTVTRTVTATPSIESADPYVTPSPRPDYCTMNNPPRDFAATVIHNTHVIGVEAAAPNPDGGVTILARQECHIAPGFGDDGQYWPTGPLRSYVIAPTARICLRSGIDPVQVSMSDLLNPHPPAPLLHQRRLDRRQQRLQDRHR